MHPEDRRNPDEYWLKAWADRVVEIDELIIGFTTRHGTLTADRIRRLTDEIRLWLDQDCAGLHDDPGWQQAKSEPHTLQLLVEQRFSQLLHDNRLCLSVVESPVVEE